MIVRGGARAAGSAAANPSPAATRGTATPLHQCVPIAADLPLPVFPSTQGRIVAIYRSASALTATPATATTMRTRQLASRSRSRARSTRSQAAHYFCGLGRNKVRGSAGGLRACGGRPGGLHSQPRHALHTAGHAAEAKQRTSALQLRPTTPTRTTARRADRAERRFTWANRTVPRGTGRKAGAGRVNNLGFALFQTGVPFRARALRRRLAHSRISRALEQPRHLYGSRRSDRALGY